jgi:hypothetical protein
LAVQVRPAEHLHHFVVLSLFGAVVRACGFAATPGY